MSPGIFSRRREADDVAEPEQADQPGPDQPAPDQTEPDQPAPDQPEAEVAPPPVSVAVQVAQADQETEELLKEHSTGEARAKDVATLGSPLQRSPFTVGLMAGLGLLLAYGLVHILLELTQILTLVLVAVFLALGLDPVVALLVRRGIRRGWGVLIVMLALVVLISLVGWMLVPTFVNQVSILIDKAPGYLTQIEHKPWAVQLDARFHIVDRIQEQAKAGVNGTAITSVLGGVLGAGKAIVDGVASVVTVLVLTLYLMVAMPGVKTAVYKVVPQGRRARVVFLGEEISGRVGGYVLGQTAVAVINGVLTYIVLILLGLPFSAVLAVLAGLLALIPILGTIVGGVVITLVALSDSWVTALFALGYYIAYHVFEAYVLSPRIMHRAVDVPAIVVILAVLAGGALLGIIGALIAIPVAAGLSLLYEQVLVPRQQSLTSPGRSPAT